MSNNKLICADVALIGFFTKCSECIVGILGLFVIPLVPGFCQFMWICFHFGRASYRAL